MRLPINFNFLLKSDLRYMFTVEKIKLEFFHCGMSNRYIFTVKKIELEFFHCVIGCALGITVNFELVFEQAAGGKFIELRPNVCFSSCNISSSLGCLI